jgi:pantetheine-phosphate adenylyltransferase
MKAIYPGAFDPITSGHLDVIKRALQLFDSLVVAVLENSSKKGLFSVDERLEMIRHATKGMNVEAVSFSGLLADFAERHGTKVVVRGLRALSDFESEFQMALFNRDLGGLESVFLMTEKEYFYLSSSSIKEIASHGGDISKYVPAFVADKLRKRKEVSRKSH